MKARFLVSTCVAAMLLGGLGVPALADGKPPFSADQAAPMVTESKISAAIEFSIPALDRTLEARIPRRLATFNDRTTSCWHREVLGRMRNIDCEYSGYVERRSPVTLRAEDGRLVAAAQLFGTVSARGARGLAALLHGNAEGEMTVSATARPDLRPDWSVGLDMRDGFRWNEEPTLNILGFRINLTRFVEPKIRSQLARVRADALASAQRLDIRGKAETAWRRSFATVQISDAPDIWLRTAPQSVAFAGMHARGNVLEGAIEIAGTAETVVGAQPAAATPTPLPQLGRGITAPGKFNVIVPVNISYDTIRQAIAQFLSSRADEGGPVLRGAEVYPSNGKLVLGLQLAPAQGAAAKWIYLTATPTLDAGNQLVRLADLAAADLSAAPELNRWLNNGALQALQQQLQLGYQAEMQKIVASANARLSRPLGDGFRSEAQLASAGLGNLRLTDTGLRIELRAEGHLKILYGL